MTALDDYKVEKSLIGLGPDILMEILSAIEYFKDTQQFVWVNKKTFALQTHHRFEKSMENKKDPVDSTAILPAGGDLNQQGLKFVHTKSNHNYCTVVFDPIISAGIAYFEVIFHFHLHWYFDVGIARSSVKFEQNYHPSRYQEPKVSYCSGLGRIEHIIGYEIVGNEVFKDEQRIGVEVNMTTTPRTVHFFVNDVEQPAHIWHEGSSFELLKFEYHTSSKSKGLPNSLALEWGKEWVDQDEIVDPNDREQEWRLQYRNADPHLYMSGELRKQQKEELEQDGEIEELDKDRVSPPLTREYKAKKQNADQTFDKLLINVAAHRANADDQ
ncbi:MAG: hypothetical protein EZS28_010645 [Streblomastix strix]|uniref:SPRY domain-containing protein n=1 Tax=Streblomastix strix TaxID=222440 RepID=A0A5J4WHJ2_9EUKA|nr:MAG: hypothetical protein EZS28_010645 [Streblomastix strix]